MAPPGEMFPPVAAAGRGVTEHPDVRALLKERGVTDEELAIAEATGTLPLLALDVAMFPLRPQYNEGQLVEAVGVDPAFAQSLWRAMGFPSLPEGEVAFNDDDVRALQTATSEELPVEGAGDAQAVQATVVRQTRVMSAAMARVAEQFTDNVATLLLTLREQGLSDEEIAGMVLTAFDLEELEQLLWYMFRRQWRAAAWRRLARPVDATKVAVGFVDLVRFSAITEHVAEEELEQLIVRFDEVTRDAIAEGGGRVVKMIGDAVMFVADDPLQATLIALGLVQAYADDPFLPPARAGLAWGSVLARDGDYFGPVVNLAARIVDIARPSRVVVSDALHGALAESGRVSLHRLPPKRLKGIGRVTLWAVGDVKPPAS